MSKIRSQMIRLAYENPELRADLLPLLKEAGASHGVVYAEYDSWRYPDPEDWLKVSLELQFIGHTKSKKMPVRQLISALNDWEAAYGKTLAGLKHKLIWDDAISGKTGFSFSHKVRVSVKDLLAKGLGEDASGASSSAGRMPISKWLEKHGWKFIGVGDGYE